jgi:hypothetical protein
VGGLDRPGAPTQSALARMGLLAPSRARCAREGAETLWALQFPLNTEEDGSTERVVRRLSSMGLSS